MNTNNYKLKVYSSCLKYEFFSIGPKGTIKKQVVFKPIENNPNVYNLGFGDVELDGEINDLVVTNNKDSHVVLATVAIALLKFFEKYPKAYVLALGSTKSRTRLYQMGISNNYEKATLYFEIYGLSNNEWKMFERGFPYEAFLVKRKNM